MKAIYSAIICSALVFAPMKTVAETAQHYLLGPQDRLMIRVYDLRRSAGEAYPWPSLTGEFAIGADGTVSLPILGEIAAQGMTTGELASVISKTLKDKVGLSDVTAGSVDVIKYRPFYIMGAVQRPGKYEYQPGLTVLQAISTAEGIARTSDLGGAQREIVSQRGTVNALAAERVALQAKSARLSAEINEEKAITFPPDLLARSNEATVAQAMREEQLLFEAHRNGLENELTAIEQSKAVLRQELTSLDTKGKSLDRQVDLNRKELGQVTDLVSKGIAVMPRQLAAEQSQASLEASRIDVQLVRLRAQQDLSRADRDVIEAYAKSRREALENAATVRGELDQNTEKARTAGRMLHDAEMRAPGLVGEEDDLLAIYRLTHVSPSGAVSRTVNENDIVEAGDVLQVMTAKQERKSDEVSSSTDRLPFRPASATRK